MRHVLPLMLALLAIPALAHAERAGGKRPAKPARAERAPAARAPAPAVEQAAASGSSEAPAEGETAKVSATPARSSPSAGSAPPARKRLALRLGAGMYVDDGTIRGRDRRSIQVVDETGDFSNSSFLFGELGVMVGVAERMRLGARLRYHGSYTFALEEEGERNETQLGQLMDLAAEADYALPLFRRVDLLLGAQAGLVLLLPSGEFEKEIRDLRAQGANVWNVPRLGYIVGPRVAARWDVGGRVSVRADLDVTLSQTFLFLTSDDVGGVQFEKTRRANVIRYALGLAMEVGL